MSLSKEQMFELMQYADGELSPDEREAVKAKLALNDDARAFVSELAKLGAWIEQAERFTVKPAMTFDIADAVIAKLDEQGDETPENAEKTEEKAIEPARAPVPSIGSIDVAREKRRRVGVFLVTAIAAAAGIAFLINRPAAEHRADLGTSHTVDKIPVASAHATAMQSPTSEASQTLANVGEKAGEPGVEVNVATDSSQTGVSVFYIPGTSSTAASAVVWIDDDTGGK